MLMSEICATNLPVWESGLIRLFAKQLFPETGIPRSNRGAGVKVA